MLMSVLASRLWLLLIRGIFLLGSISRSRYRSLDLDLDLDLFSCLTADTFSCL
jgi:hypothetical protein